MWNRVEEVSLTQAVAECYMFKPRSHKKVIIFEIVFDNATVDSDGKERTMVLGKKYDTVMERWCYVSGQKGFSFESEEKHLIPNLVCNRMSEIGLNYPLLYSAQQGKFKVWRIETENTVLPKKKGGIT